MTLTYDPARLGWGREASLQDTSPSAAPLATPRRFPWKPSEWKFASDVKYWLRDGQNAIGRPIAGVVAMERHKNGWPHGHGLLDTNGLQRGEVAILGRLWYKRAGGNRLEAPGSVDDVSEYTAKYVTKADLEQLILAGELGQRRFVSFGLEGAHPQRVRRLARRGKRSD